MKPMKIKTGIVKWFWILLSLLAFMPEIVAADPQDSPPLPAVLPTQAPEVPQLSVHWSFSDLGRHEPLPLTGAHPAADIAFGIRLDQVVQRARLHLIYSYSPALIAALSHLKISLNNEVVATAPLPTVNRAGEISQDIDLNPELFTDYNHLTLEFIGHYTTECEDQNHSSLWMSISNRSDLELETTALPLVNDLSLLPSPFFDNRDNHPLHLSFVFAGHPDSNTLQAAGVIASWFGALADYRDISFQAAVDHIPEGHSILLLKNGSHINGLNLPPAERPTLQLIASPATPANKLLVISGKNSADLLTAARALVLGRAVLAGRLAEVTASQLNPPRQPYDAPNWVPTNRPVRIGELVRSTEDLQRNGEDRRPININVRLPADLFTWRSQGVALNLKYRYTAPASEDNSLINLSINHQFLKTIRLHPNENTDDSSHLLLKLLDSQSVLAHDALTIPAFRVGANNQIQISYEPEAIKKNSCNSALLNNQQAAIDPDSTIDFSPFPHYIAMPNLSVFVNTGFPFTQYADLARTTLVLPDTPDIDTIGAALTLLGRLGASTGYPGTRLTVRQSSELKLAHPSLKEHNDLLILGTAGNLPLLRRWQQDLPAVIGAAQRTFKGSYSIDSEPIWQRQGVLGDPTTATTAINSFLAGGQTEALFGFQSPLAPGRSVVVLTASASGGLRDLVATLSDNNKISRIHGDLALIHGPQIESFQIGQLYHLGHLPLLVHLWLMFADHPLLLALAACVTGLLFALGLYLGLQMLAVRRMQRR